MSKVIMLTKDKCPKCLALKMYLEKGLRNQYAEDIEVLHLEDEPDRFYDYVRKFDLLATPVLIAGQDVLLDTAPTKVNDFLKKVIG